MTLTLSDVRNWLMGVGVGENFYVGKLDNKKDYSIGVYQRSSVSSGKQQRCIGGKDATKTLKKEVSVLVHWNKNHTDTEKAALELFEKIEATAKTTFGLKQIDCIIMNCPEPIDVGSDNKGVYEYVIWFTIYYQK